MPIDKATAVAHPNIAWIKYWQSGNQSYLSTIQNPDSEFTQVQQANIPGSSSSSPPELVLDS